MLSIRLKAFKIRKRKKKGTVPFFAGKEMVQIEEIKRGTVPFFFLFLLEREDNGRRI